MSLSLVESRLTAWDIKVDCERIAARPESKFQEGGVTHLRPPNSVALSCELDIGALEGTKVTDNLGGPKNFILPSSDLPGMPRSEKRVPLEPKLRGVNGE